MSKRVTPMIHVPDVSETVNWYESIGFTVGPTYGNEGGGLSFAILSFGDTQVMFNQGGQTSSAHRREVDLYAYTENIDGLFDRLKDRVDVVEGPHDTFYGMRELIIRDINRFWITFGEETAFGQLMNGVRSHDIEAVHRAIGRGVKTEALTLALMTATHGEYKNEEIAKLLESSGAPEAPSFSDALLQSHAGHYQSATGMSVEIKVIDNQLVAEPAGQGAIPLMPIDEVTFRPVNFDGASVKFKSEAGVSVSFALSHGSETIVLNRVFEKAE
jgi:hypothetical protein